MPLIPTNKSNNETYAVPSNKTAAIGSSAMDLKKNLNNELTFEISDPKYSIEEMILSDSVKDEIDTIIKAQESWKKVFIDWDLQSVLKQRKNIFVNLYGESGTGKTMAAHAIAKTLGKKIICVNYADIESKYVGETSKNITSLFKIASEKNVILFFDEADALLSKRVTNMSNSTDVSVNQTRSVLLTLLNDYEGMVIFATNFISNYDSAFMRRIQYHVKFELPDTTLRKSLWKRYIPDKMPNNVDKDYIAKKYSGISGSDISNAVLKAALKAAKNKDDIVDQKYFENAIIEILKSKEANNNTKVTINKIDESEVPTDIKEHIKQVK